MSGQKSCWYNKLSLAEGSNLVAVLPAMQTVSSGVVHIDNDAEGGACEAFALRRDDIKCHSKQKANTRSLFPVDVILPLAQPPGKDLPLCHCHCPNQSRSRLSATSSKHWNI